jgi:hypothetical protein
VTGMTDYINMKRILHNANGELEVTQDDNAKYITIYKDGNEITFEFDIGGDLTDIRVE